MGSRTPWNRWFSLPNRADQLTLRAGKSPRRRRLNLESLEQRNLFAIAPAGPEFQVPSWTTGAQNLDINYGKSIAIDPSGNFVITWDSPDQPGGSGKDVYAQRYLADGTPGGSEFRVNSVFAGDQYGASIAMNDNGDFVIAWVDAASGFGAIRARRFNAAGVPQGSDFRVNAATFNEFEPSVAMDNTGNFVVTWTRLGEDPSFGIYGRRFDAANVAQGTDFHVNITTTDGQWYSTVAMDADGDFVVTWQSRDPDGYNVYFRRYNAAGTALSNEVKVDPVAARTDRHPKISMSNDGEFVIAWEATITGPDVVARRYDATGTAVGSEFRVNDYTVGNQWIGSIDMDDDGNFVASWTSVFLDGDGDGLYARRISSSNARLGSEFRVNTWTTDDQNSSSAALSASGNVVINWRSTGQDGDNYGVYAQRYQAQANQGPTATGFADLTTFEDAGNLTLNLQSGFNDLEDGAPLLTYSVQSNSDTSLVSATAIAGSQLTLAFGANAFGNATLTLRATDSEGAFVETPVTISVLPLNDAPVLVNSSLTLLEGQALTLTSANLLVTDADHSPSELTYTLTGNVTTGSLQKNSVPIFSGGTFTQQDVNDGLISYTHNGTEFFADSFSFRISDRADTGNPIAISRVSLTSAGNQANGNSTLAAISGDGKLVAFTSTATNLVAGDTNSRADIFVRNLTTGVTTRASVDSSGVEANGNSTEAHFSPDGRYLVFSSTASNLVASDTNGATDIFLRDLQTNTTTLLSNIPGGGFGNGNSTFPAFSLDGRYATFVSTASDLVLGDTNGVADVFVRDLQFGTTIRASVGLLGVQGNNTSSSPMMTAGGRYVVFSSNASNLVTSDSNGAQDVFVRDLATNTTSRVSLNFSGTQPTSGNSTNYYPSMSVDGRYLTFESLANNVVASDTNASADVFLRDLQAGVNSRLSVTTAGAQVSGTSRAPVISANGRYVVFVSNSGGLVTSDTNGTDDVFIRDLQSNTTRRVSLAPNGTVTSGASTLATVSADGRYVAFEATSTNVVPGDTNGASDIFLRDMGQIATSFSIFILSVNEAPTLDPIAPISISENAGEQVVALTGITAGTGEASPLTVTAVSSDTTLIEHPTVVYTSSQSTGTIRFQPSLGKSGTAVITVTVTDTGGTANGGINTVTQTITVTVNDTIENIAPTVTGVYGADATGVPFASPIEQDSQEASHIANLVVAFSENMATVGATNIASAEHWLLQRNGADITSQITGVTFSFNATTNRHEALLSLASPLADGAYQLTVRSSVTDLAGNRLDGDAIASGFSENHVHRFTVEQPVAASSEFRVNTTTTNAQQRTAVASSAGGGYVVVWESVQDGPSSYGIYAQRYNASGIPLGSEFRVNTITGGHQRVPAVDMDDDGDFVVAWTSYLHDGSGDGIFAQRFNALGVMQGSQFQVNTYTTGDQRYANVSLDADGDFVVAWTDYDGHDGGGRGIFAQRFNAAGVAQGNEFQVNSSTTAAQQFAAMTMDPQGNFVIAWENSNGQDGAGYGIFAQRYDAAGLAQGSEFRVNSYTTNHQQAVAVAGDRDGNFVVTWQSARDGSGTGIYGQRFNAAGVAQGSEFAINTSTTAGQTLPHVTMDADGDFVVAWVSADQDGSDLGVFAQRFNAVGVAQGSEFRVNSYTTGEQRFPSLAAGADGDFLISWVGRDQDGSSNGVYAQYFAASSRVIRVQVVGAASAIEPGERLISSIPSGANLTVTFSNLMSQVGGTAGPASVTNPVNYQLTRDGIDISSQITSVSYSGVAATLTLSSTLASANYLLTVKNSLQDDRGRALDGDADGTPGADYVHPFTIQSPSASGSEFRINTTTTQHQLTYDSTTGTVATSATGDFVVVWAQGQFATPYGIYAQRYNAAGVPQGSEFRVSPASTATQTNPAVAMDADGDFVVTWTSTVSMLDTGNGIYAQRFNAAGLPQGNVLHVNTYTTGSQSNAYVAMDASGDFVVAWGSDAQDGHSSGVYAQRYEASGARQGSEFRVNTYTTNGQTINSVAINADGDFVIAWTSFGQAPGSFEDVFARRYSRTGGALGSVFLVNTTVSSRQYSASVAMSDSGEFAVAWTGLFQDGDWEGVYMQRYDAAGTPLGSNVLVNSFTTGKQFGPVVSMDADGDFVVVWQSSAGVFDEPNSQDGSAYGIFAQRFSSVGSLQGSEFRVNSYTTGDQLMAGVAMDDDGDFVVVWNSDGQDGSGYGRYGQRFASPAPFQVTSYTPTYSGFEVEFARPFNPSVLNLYDEGTTLGPTDVTLVGATSGSVRGSVVIDPGSRKLTFIKTDGPLTPDTYTLSLRSHASGFVDASGNLLDGNRDGLSGDNYTAQFTVAPPSGVTLSVRDFVRGYGQNVVLAPDSGLPVTISNAAGVRNASFAMLYDPTLLSITGATLGAGLTGSVTLDTSLYGVARITITSPSQLTASSGVRTLVTLTASVPSNAPYGSKHVLDLTNIQLSDTLSAAIPALDNDGIHIAAYFGDSNGSQSYNSPDATLTQRMIVGLDSGLLAYQLADPLLIVDVSGNGSVQSNDVTFIQQAIVGTANAHIPTLPGGAPSAPGGPDPIVSLPQNLSASVGETITVPVQLLVTEPTGVTVAGVDLAIAYDPDRLELNSVLLGQLLVGFGLSANLATPGIIKLSSAGSAPLDLPFEASGVLAELEFTVLDGVGPTRLNLLANDASLYTALYDDRGRSLLLQPAPTNEDDDSVDGLIEILAVDQVLARQQ